MEAKDKRENMENSQSSLENILDSLFERIKDVVSSETIVGKPITVGNLNVYSLEGIPPILSLF